MTNLEEIFLNVLEGRRYAVVESMRVVEKWLSLDNAIKKCQQNPTYYLYVWHDNKWNPANTLDGTIMDYYGLSPTSITNLKKFDKMVVKLIEKYNI